MPSCSSWSLQVRVRSNRLPGVGIDKRPGVVVAETEISQNSLTNHYQEKGQGEVVVETEISQKSLNHYQEKGQGQRFLKRV